jgi:ABC-type bacteriocin/lantibiotic exporter with double-glycine peptidase domain
MRLNPEMQGTLDSLCGLYAITNAFRLALKDKEENGEKIFHAILDCIPNNQLARFIKLGMTLRQVLYVLRRSAPKFGLAFEVVPCARKGRFQKLAKQQYPLIIGVEDNNKIWGGGHWTVIRKITPKHVKLQDSSVFARQVSRRKFPEFDMKEIIRVYKP